MSNTFCSSECARSRDRSPCGEETCRNYGGSAFKRWSPPTAVPGHIPTLHAREVQQRPVTVYDWTCSCGESCGGAGFWRPHVALDSFRMEHYIPVLEKK